MTKLFQVHDDLFDSEFINLVDSYCKQSTHWYFGRGAAVGSDSKFWGAFLYQEGDPKIFFIEYIHARFRKASDLKFRIKNVALNGQTSNQAGGWHTDLYGGEDVSRTLTMLYYVNSDWNDAKGSTWIKLPDGSQEEIKYVPGRVICFPSEWLHLGDCPETHNLLRMTMAFKLELL